MRVSKFDPVSVWNVPKDGSIKDYPPSDFLKTYRFAKWYLMYTDANNSFFLDLIKIVDDDTKVFYSYHKKAIRLFNSILWDSYQSDLQDFMPIADKFSSSFGWISQNALEYNRYKV